jgi:hypothetical protein
MRHECRLIALSVLALLASGVLQAQAQRPAAPRTAAHGRVSHPSRGLPHPAGTATAPLHSVAATAASTVTAHAAARITPVAGPHRSPGAAANSAVTPIARTNAAAGAYRSSVRRRGPVNVALGGPATFDARKLVRR